MTLRILTPDGVLLDTKADSVVMPALDGALGVMRGHAPMIAALKEGKLLYRSGKETHTLIIAGGTAEVRDNVITILSGTSVL